MIDAVMTPSGADRPDLDRLHRLPGRHSRQRLTNGTESKACR
jgi:hypothetical protein